VVIGYDDNHHDGFRVPELKNKIFVYLSEKKILHVVDRYHLNSSNIPRYFIINRHIIFKTQVMQISLSVAHKTM
jgi:hypothetical protein